MTLTWITDARMIHPCHSLHPVQHLRGQPGEAPWPAATLSQLRGTKTGHSSLGVPDKIFFFNVKYFILGGQILFLALFKVMFYILFRIF